MLAEVEAALILLIPEQVDLVEAVMERVLALLVRLVLPTLAVVVAAVEFLRMLMVTPVGQVL
jgi:hypothetical protein